MEQHVRYCATPEGRIAYATVGEGPPLVLPTWWCSHVEADWSSPRFRAFLAPLAEGRTLIRYDRLGCGASERSRPPQTLTLDAELEVLEALVRHLGLRRFPVLGLSCGAAIGVAFAGRHPGVVERLVALGGYVHGAGMAPQNVRTSVVAMVRAHWGLGSRMMSELFLGDADANVRAEFATAQRAAARADVAADLLELVYRLDARADARRVRCPTLVAHRRGDRAVPYRLGRQLAALVPDAELVTLEGRNHVPWYAGADEVLDAIGPFLGVDRGEAPSEEDLSAREVEVLRLVADGLSDADIAEQLFLSPHTVHRHVANIRAKLRQPSRAAAVAHAARAGVL
ncbi:MAG: alpha/beta fold hydrolase [Solirubrobacterales bacterium]|nr:alpha/beta fold hydrolase [Solirubrobacterales bacterium]